MTGISYIPNNEIRENILNNKYSPEVFAQLLKKFSSNSEKRRFQAMDFLASGLEREFINASLRLGRNTLGQWVARVNESGPESLFTSPKPGAPRKLNEAQTSQIIEEVSRNPRALGFRQSSWDA